MPVDPDFGYILCMLLMGFMLQPKYYCLLMNTVQNYFHYMPLKLVANTSHGIKSLRRDSVLPKIYYLIIRYSNLLS